jgi:uncharacterized protein (DUF427 family)
MTDRKVLIPDVDHPINIERCRSTVFVAQETLRIARTRSAMTLLEASYPPVQYVPRGDVDMSLLERSQQITYCPYKGEASYYSIPALGETGLNCVWTYEAPFEAVRDIAGLLAFYADRVTVELVGQPDPVARSD